jgi:hypothetical protein
MKVSVDPVSAKGIIKDLYSKGGCMSRVCSVLPILIILFCVGLSNSSDQVGLVGVSQEISTAPDGSAQERFVTNPSGSMGFSGVPTPAAGMFMPDTSVLWVDRNHLNAIANDVFLSGDGMNILVGWWLNQQRVSFYRTLANETPIWHRSFVSDWQIPVGGSFDGSALAATGTGPPLTEWNKTSFVPNWTFSWPSGYRGVGSNGVSISEDGTRLASVCAGSGDGILYVFDVATGDTVYTRHFNPTSGVYGVDLSDDGLVALVSTYDMLFIWDDGESRGTLGNYGQTTARISGDGSVVVMGDFNGNVKAYRWNAVGHYYDLKIQDNTGHPWVTAVAVSADGSTVMAGTYQYNPSSSGKVLMYDTTSSTPLWEYSNYGDYVNSVALTPDGSRGVAGSWGQYGGTFGEVLSVFERSSSTPIFALLDDIDEPGSIFAVAISDGGDYVAAGGKAVHAREMGNGGQVYAIIIGEVPAANVGTASIDNPGIYLEKGSAVAPMATFANYGKANATFWTYYSVFDSLGAVLYSDSQQVVDLAPGLTQQNAFTSTWAPAEYGWYKVVAYTSLVGDAYAGDDTLLTIAKCMHAARAVAVRPPFPEVTVKMALNPAVTIVNEGSYTDTVTCYISILDSLGGEVYSDTETANGLKPDSSFTVGFKEWIPQEVGDYSAVAWTWVTDEHSPSNDSTEQGFACTYEIIYDDGSADIYIVVDFTYYDNKFAQRFTPTIDYPYYLTRARVWVNGTNAFELTAHQDSSGLPGKILAGPDTVAASSAPGWVVKDYSSIPLDIASDFWIQVHWLPTSPGAPAIGADANGPRELRSWWYWDNPSNPGWHNWTAHDWMIRATALPPLGVEDRETEFASIGVKRFNLYESSPNPFCDRTTIRFDLGMTDLSAGPQLEVFDAAGRIVKSFDIHGGSRDSAGEVSWDGRSREGARLPAGVYFLRLTAGEKTATRKMVVLR